MRTHGVSWVQRRGVALAVLVITSVLNAASAVAQNLKPSSVRRGQELLHLVVRPRVGDTLWMQLDQTVETRNVSAAESASRTNVGSGANHPAAARSPGVGPVREQPVTQSIVMRMFAHSLVDDSTMNAISLTAMPDSLLVRSGAAGHLSPFRRMALPPGERVVHLHVGADGAMAVADTRAGTSTLGKSLAAMPPMLPANAVSVGDQWQRAIPLPALSLSGVKAEGVVHAQFRLDSVSNGGKLAYVSMTGTLRRDGGGRELAPGTQFATAGTLHGSLVLDRTRGWITEAETIINVQSDMTPSAGDNSPVRSMDIRLVQRMKVR